MKPATLIYKTYQTVVHRRTLIGMILLCIFLIGNSLIISARTQPYLFTTINQTPTYTVGLVFGTRKIFSSGKINIFFTKRIEQTIALYKAGKILYILVSGDNGSTSYDEPSAFKEALIAGGVPAERIILDYAGFSTWDSVVRAKQIFGVSDMLLISQDFQVQRGLVMCRYQGISCGGSATDSVSFWIGPRIYIREYLARGWLLIDMITNRSSVGGKSEPTPRRTKK